MSALALLLLALRVVPLLVLARGALFRGDAARRVEEVDGRLDGDGPRRAWMVGIACASSSEYLYGIKLPVLQNPYLQPAAFLYDAWC